MKGAVFIALNDMIEEHYGIDTWEELLAEVQPECEGIYVSTEDYPDTEITHFVRAISSKTGLPSTEVTRIFGESLFHELNTKYPMFAENCNSLFDFLNSIENVIHTEVRKLFEQTSLPSIDCKTTHDQLLKMDYKSPRKLCYLAEGLIQGASIHFQEPVKIEHAMCMHDGNDHCEFHIKKL